MAKQKGIKPAKRAGNRSYRPISDWLLPVLVGIVTLVVFSPALANGFIWDDRANLVDNPHYRGLGWVQLKWMFSSFLLGHYQPLSWMTLGLDYLIWGMDPFGYHLTNLLLHAATAAAFFFLALQLLSLGLSSPAAHRDPALRIAAAVGALLFAIHPLRTESVAWVTERRDVLSGLLLACTLLFYLRAAGAADAASRWRFLIPALGCYLLSLLSKAAGMTLPLVMLVLDIYPLRRLKYGEWFTSEARRVWREKLLFAAVAVPFAVLALIAQQHAGALKPLGQYGIPARAAQAFYGIAFYLWKTIAPYRLSPLYELSPAFDPLDWPFLLSGLVVVALSIAFTLLRHRWPAGLAAWICYVALLSPVLGIAQSGVQMAADRYTYLSCMPWAIVAGAGVFYACRMRGSGRIGRGTFAAALGLVAVVLLGLGGSTRRQVQLWHDSKRLWQYAVEVSPQSAIARYNLGVALEEHGDSDGAIDSYRTALRYNSDYWEAHLNLARALANRGEAGEAIAHYRRVLALKPGIAEVHTNLADLLFGRGDVAQAIDHLRTAIAIDPRYAQAYNNLGVALSRQGDVDGAIRQYRKAIEANPANALAYYNLGNLLAEHGRPAEAVEQLRAGLAHAPNDGRMHYRLGSILLKQGSLEEALRHLRAAVRLDPANARARYSLAAALAQQGEPEAAIRELHEVLRSAPDMAAAHEALSRLLAAQGKKEEALRHSAAAQRLMKRDGSAPSKP